MSVDAKICGLNDAAALAAAVEGGAAYVGFVFYPRSPRHVSPARCAELAAAVPAGVNTVGVVVDPTDEFLTDLFREIKLSHLQLHGSETPDRVVAIRALTGASIIKAVKVAAEDDVAGASAFADVADMVLFDAKPPKVGEGILPGGNALAFDWRLIGAADEPAAGLPWILSGGLDMDNVGEAGRISGARAVDVSSGVERAPGQKDPDLIRKFLTRVASLQA